MKFVCLAISLALIANTATAAETGYSNAQQHENRDYRAAVQHVSESRYSDAIVLLLKVTNSEPDNADAYSLLGFSYRKSGDVDRSGKAYQQALSLQQNHLNALEYQGELFLMLGQVDKAEANLKRISKQCLFVCEQERLLEAAITKWRQEN